MNGDGGNLSQVETPLLERNTKESKNHSTATCVTEGKKLRRNEKHGQK